MRAPSHCTILPGLALSALCVAATLADDVKLVDRPVFRRVQIVGFRDGILAFRGLSGEVLRTPLERVEWCTLDRAPALQQAREALLAGRGEVANRLLEAAADACSESWLRHLILLQRIDVLATMRRTDRAVEAYLELLEAAGPALASAAPQTFAARGSPENRRAMTLLTDSLPNLRATSRDAAIRLALELSLLEGLPPPDSVATPQQPATDEAPAGETDPPLMFDDLPATIDASVQISIRGPLAHAAAQEFDRGAAGLAAELLTAGRPYVRGDDLSAWDLRLGRALLAQQEYVSAADHLMRAAGAEDTMLSAEGFFYAGQAYESLDRMDVALSLYADALRCAPEGTPVHRLVRQRLDSLRATPEGAAAEDAP